MNARTATFLWATAPPRSVEPLLAALHDAFAAFGEKPVRMFVSGPGDVKHTAYNAARLEKAAHAAETVSVAVKGPGEASVSVSLFLRDWVGHEQFMDRRHAMLVCPPVAPDDARLLQFLEAACSSYPVAHGGVFLAPTSAHAAADGVIVGGSALGADTQKRIHFDAMNAPRALQLLRRLYPVTIIGPEIWATLPPLPEVEPPLVVRDLADCKTVTAWPTLVDPHDLPFLLGTRALRRWLWPYTIQNPADDPHEIDIRLRWAELLPW